MLTLLSRRRSRIRRKRRTFRRSLVSRTPSGLRSLRGKDNDLRFRSAQSAVEDRKVLSFVCRFPERSIFVVLKTVHTRTDTHVRTHSLTHSTIYPPTHTQHTLTHLLTQPPIHAHTHSAITSKIATWNRILGLLASTSSTCQIIRQSWDHFLTKIQT
jgi:hypothetical protein